MTTPAASGIVLAGGRSTRFGRDKLAEIVDARPLLHRAVDAVAGVCTEVVVVIGPDQPTPELPAGVALRIVRDPEPFGGPLVGLLAGLEEAREPIALVVAGDMPTLQPAVLAALLRSLDDTDSEVGLLEHQGRATPLPAALRNGAATPVAQRLLAQGERRLTALMDSLRARVIEESNWRGLDPAAATLRDIDLPGDLP
jgi:molybdopterin-guanine dinucleotide biosynthesis protein A